MSNEVHVVPVNDLIEHDEESDDCVCGPDCEPVKREDGSVGWVISHNSLDGRENHPAITTTVEPLFGKTFSVIGDYNPTLRERMFGKKDTCTCDPDRWIFPDHFNDCPLDKD